MQWMLVLLALKRWKKKFSLLFEGKTMQAMHFLVGIIFDLFLMVVLLRFWLQAAKADFYNPMSQFVVKATSFAVNPLRKIIPGVGGFDIASLVLAYLVAVAKLSVIFLMFITLGTRSGIYSSVNYGS